MEHKRKKQWILIIMLLLTVCSVFCSVCRQGMDVYQSF